MRFCADHDDALSHGIEQRTAALNDLRGPGWTNPQLCCSSGVRTAEYRGSEVMRAAFLIALRQLFGEIRRDRAHVNVDAIRREPHKNTILSQSNLSQRSVISQDTEDDRRAFSDR